MVLSDPPLRRDQIRVPGGVWKPHSPRPALPSTARSMMVGRAFLVLVLTGACQFGHGVGGLTTNFIHSGVRLNLFTHAKNSAPGTTSARSERAPHEHAPHNPKTQTHTNSTHTAEPWRPPTKKAGNRVSRATVRSAPGFASLAQTSTDIMCSRDAFLSTWRLLRLGFDRATCRASSSEPAESWRCRICSRLRR